MWAVNVTVASWVTDLCCCWSMHYWMRGGGGGGCFWDQDVLIFLISLYRQWICVIRITWTMIERSTNLYNCAILSLTYCTCLSNVMCQGNIHCYWPVCHVTCLMCYVFPIVQDARCKIHETRYKTLFKLGMVINYNQSHSL